MRIASRTARRLDSFDKRLDATVTPLLHAAGFAESQPYVFTREDAEGQDVVYLDVEPKSFIVQVAYRPRYMDEIEDLYAHTLQPSEPRIGAFSYLTPTTMIHRPKEFPARLARQRDHSFQLVINGLKTHVLSWLMRQRDPVCYADAVPPTMVMFVARANEMAQRFHEAREAYEEMFRRLLACWEMVTFAKFAESEGSRAFVYVCLKLQRELEKASRVMEATKYRPQVVPLSASQ